MNSEHGQEIASPASKRTIPDGRAVIIGPRGEPARSLGIAVGRLRAYFDIEEEPARVVKIRAVGIKDRNRVLIGGEEVELR